MWIEQAFWFLATAWVWAVLAIMALGPVVALAMIGRRNEIMQRIERDQSVNSR